MTGRLDRMEQHADAMESTLSALHSAVMRIDEKLEQQAASFGQQMQKMTDGFDRQSQKLLTLVEHQALTFGAQLEKLNAKMDHQTQLFEHKMTMMSQQFDAKLEKQSQHFDARIDRLDDKIEHRTQLLEQKMETQAVQLDGKLKDQKLAIIVWILGLPSLVFGLYELYKTFISTQ